MTKTRREWKREAKIALRGNYSIMILGMFATLLASNLASSITNYFFSGSGTFTWILSEIFSFVVSLVLSLFSAGYVYMNLKIARREGTTLGDILYFFKNGSDQVIIAGVVMTSLQFLASVPMMIFNYTVPIGETVEEIAHWNNQFLGMMILTLILQMVLTIPFTLSYYLLTDYPEMSGMEAVKTSMKMMKGHKLVYLILQISFYPIIFGSVFTFYIALLWILPYMNMTMAEFYRDLNGEFEQGPAEIYADYIEVEEPDVIQKLSDDDHSEA